MQERPMGGDALDGVLHFSSCLIGAYGESISVPHCTVYQNVERQRRTANALHIDKRKLLWTTRRAKVPYHITIAFCCRWPPASRDHNLGPLPCCLSIIRVYCQTSRAQSNLTSTRASFCTIPDRPRYCQICHFPMPQLSYLVFSLTCITDPRDLRARPITMQRSTVVQSTTCTTYNCGSVAPH